MAARVAGDKIERKYMAHFIDASFGGTTSYVRLGKDLEALDIEMNPDKESKQNILGETSVNVKGFSPSVAIDNYYCYEDDALYTHLESVINSRSTGSALNTTVVDVILDNDGTVVSAFRENVVVIPQKIGGGSDGLQIPFTYDYCGGRVSGTWTVATNTFTPVA